MSQGRFTFKGLFKSKDGKTEAAQQILQNISQLERDIQNYDIIKNYLLIYLHDIAIPAFQNQKMKNYVNAMISFCNQELENSTL